MARTITVLTLGVEDLELSVAFYRGAEPVGALLAPQVGASASASRMTGHLGFAEGDGYQVVQEVHVRTGPLGSWLNRRELDAVRKHMKEEGENLKRLLESGGQDSEGSEE